MSELAGPFDLIACDPPWDYTAAGAIRHYRGTRSAPAHVHYDCMGVPAMIQEFRPLIDGWAAPDCALVMWATWPKLPEALQLIDGWGFEYVTCCLVWVKTYTDPAQGRLFMPDLDREAVCGMGFYTRGNTEFCLYARRGKPAVPEDRTVRQLVFERDPLATEEEFLRRLLGESPGAIQALVRERLGVLEALTADAEVVFAQPREHSRKPEEAKERIERLWPKARRLEMFAREARPGWHVWGNQTDKFAAERRGETEP